MKPHTVLFEIAWEVCNQIGGIFTYLKSKIPTMMDTYGDDYFLLGPYFPDNIKSDFRSINDQDDSPLSRTVSYMRSLGFDVQYGYWLLEDSRPRVLLFSPILKRQDLNEVKTRLWNEYELSTIEPDEVIDQVIGFGEVLRIFFTEFIKQSDHNQDVILHFHEWMSASCLPELVDEKVRLATVFTTHSTLLGRYLAPNEVRYFTRLPRFDWLEKAREYGIETRVKLERNIVKKAHVFATDSGNTAKECEAFLNRTPDSIIYNGINKQPVQRYELFELYQQNRDKIDAFIKALFLPSYHIKTEKTLYFFTSGRYEYRNKGFDITLEAIARLNELLIRQKSDVTIVLFIISKRPYHYIKPHVLEARQRYLDLKKICGEISERLGPKLYSKVTSINGQKLPNLNELVDEELLHTWKQAVLNFKKKVLPAVTTHQLTEEDQITQFCQIAGLDNKELNRVKVVYHPDFMERARSLFSMDYQEFIKGCNLGIFPSLYEPWGYTPMETAMAGTPVISSDSSGFGQLLTETMPEHESDEMYVINRRFQSDEEAINQLTSLLYNFSETFIREQYIPRACIDKKIIDKLCWTNLQPLYHDAYRLAFIRSQPETHLY